MRDDGKNRDRKRGSLGSLYKKWAGISTKTKMHIHIVERFHSDAMRHMADPIQRLLTQIGVETTSGEEPDATAVLNYCVPWTLLGAGEIISTSKYVVDFTHVNPDAEGLLRHACRHADAVVAMSYAGWQELADRGIARSKLSVCPVGIEGFSPRPLVVGVVGAVQPNGRKREHILLDIVWV